MIQYWNETPIILHHGLFIIYILLKELTIFFVIVTACLTVVPALAGHRWVIACLAEAGGIGG
jgi:hypothetical protein